jgi:FAD:protein FMN transferase
LSDAAVNRVFLPDALVRAGTPAHGSRLLQLRGRTMGTTWSLHAYAPGGMASTIETAAQEILDRVVAQMSTWEPRSDISLFNAAATGTWQRLPEEFFQVLACALHVAEQSGGAYDPTIGPLVNLWGFGPSCAIDDPRQSPPDAAQVDAQRALCGWRKLELNAQRRSARQCGGLYLDLSAIAKGYAVDLLAEYLEGLAYTPYLVEVGGELRGQGLKPDCQPWWVELERPDAAEGMTRSLIGLHGLSVATSGDYRRYFDWKGRRYAHTIDPRSGAPCMHRTVSVSVLHEQCMAADAWSTALGVMGSDEGLAFAGEHGIAALFVDRCEEGLRERISPAMAALLE